MRYGKAGLNKLQQVRKEHGWVRYKSTRQIRVRYGWLKANQGKVWLSRASQYKVGLAKGRSG